MAGGHATIAGAAGLPSAEAAAQQFALGNALAAQGRRAQAIACYRAALELRRDFPEASCNLGAALRDEGRPREALACYEDAIRLRPDMVEAHFNLGLALQALGDMPRALEHFEHVVALRPQQADAQYALGYLYAYGDRRADALRCFEAAAALNPEYIEARWGIAMSQLLAVCGPEDDAERGRSAFSAALQALDHWIDERRASAGAQAVGSIQPFRLAYHDCDNRALLERHGRLCARIMAAWSRQERIVPSTARLRGEPLRVAVVSGYFRHHSVWNAIVKGWFQKLDPARVVLNAYCLGTDHDQETLVARARAAHFEQGAKPLREWVDAILRERPHAVIYPEIGMDPMALRLAALRLAPVQLVAWGHPETSGLPTIDHYLSAEDFEPPDADEQYTENLVRLPRLGCYVEPTREEPEPLRIENLGLRPERPLFVCPGTPFKYAPGEDALLVRMASRLHDCQLVFFTYHQPELSRRLRQRLEAAFRDAGVDPERHLRFLPWLSPAQFRGLLGRADACLDTVGFSGFNTAMQAIECGTPIVAKEGRFMRGRFASGILRRLGLPELVAATDDEYLAIAARLAREGAYAAGIRQQIAARRALLFCDTAPVQALEQLLEEATRR